MKLLKLVIKNFLSHNETQIDFSNYKILILSGLNGVGKSSIFEAIDWCLFGKCRVDTNKLRNTNDVRNLDKKVYVSLKFEFNNKIYKIARTLTGSQDIIIYENEKELDIINKTAKQEFIEKLLGTNYILFLYTNYLRQGTLNHFSNLQLAEKKQLLSVIFNFEVFKKCYKKVYKNLQEINSHVSNIQFYLNDSTISDTEDINEINKKLDAYKDKLKSINKDIKKVNIDKINKYIEDEKKVQKMEYDISSNEDKISSKERMIKSNNETIDESKTKCEHITKKCPFLINTLNNTEDLSADLRSLKTKNETLSKEYEIIKESLGESLKDKLENYEQLNDEKNSLEVKIKENEIYIEGYAEKKEKLVKYNDELKKYDSRKTIYQNLLEIFGNNGFTLYLLLQYSVYLNKIIEHIKNKFQMHDFDIKFTIKNAEDLGTYDLIISKNDLPSSYDNLSGGQRVKLDLVLRFAFIELLNKLYGTAIPILLIDEFAELDAPNIDLIIGIIEYYSKQYTQIFIATHLIEIKERFGDSLLITVDENNNTIIKESKNEV